MDVTLIVVGNLIVEDFVAPGEVGDVVFLAQIRDSALKIIVTFFQLSLRFGMIRAGEFEQDIQRAQCPIELSVNLR